MRLFFSHLQAPPTEEPTPFDRSARPMPIHYLFSTDLLILKIRGVVTFGDFFRSWKRIMSDRSFQPPIDVLVDLRQTHLDLPGHDLEQLICYWRRSPLFKKIAMVVEQDVTTYTKCRILCVKAEYSGFSIQVFVNIKEAMAWFRELAVV
jgi:hypothetical protein